MLSALSPCLNWQMTVDGILLYRVKSEAKQYSLLYENALLYGAAVYDNWEVHRIGCYWQENIRNNQSLAKENERLHGRLMDKYGARLHQR